MTDYNKQDETNLGGLVVHGPEPVDYSKGLEFRYQPPESPENASHRRQLAAAEAKAQRFKDTSLFIVALLGAVILGTICIYILLTQEPTIISTLPDGKQVVSSNLKWQFSTSILISMASAFLGYLTGKHTSNSKSTK
jgi:hypothetical protein